ncbi:Uncharacterized protein APZ42_008377 [Daphnia magna]|uniref:Uncharacterized protein n=2 Tax=Daphnia magna TaxID=35525 RepID=A0A164EP37_9CRUS|nr:hypothetical protein OUZ56_010730 [Daphnia magna]KZR96982.1 Uncharacterized protein APZ42_008377 [Daphnia magna]
MDGELRTEDLPGKRLKDDHNRRTTLTEVVVQLKPINNVVAEKEAELRQLCATEFSPALIKNIKDLIRLGIDVNANGEEKGTRCIICVNTIQFPT